MENQETHQKTEIILSKEAQKATPEKTSQPSAKEKQALLNEHEKTKKRIAEAEKSLSGCEALLKLFPDGTLKKEAEKRYAEAKKILRKVEEEFKTLIPAVVGVVTRITEGIRKIDELGAERFRKLEALGIPRETAEKYLSSNSEKSGLFGVDRMIDFLTQTKKLGVNHEDAFSVWSDLDLMAEPEDLIGVIKKLQAIGIKENFSAIYELCRKGATDSEKLRVARALDALKISKQDIIDFTQSAAGKGMKIEEIGALIGQMRKAGFTDHFFDGWSLAGFVPANEKVDYKRIYELLPLGKFLNTTSIYSMVKYMTGDVNDVKNYVMAFVSDPLISGECTHDTYLIAEMYKVEKDPKKATAYFHILVENGLSGQDLLTVASPLYQIIEGKKSSVPEKFEGETFLTPMEVCKHILAIGKKIEAQGVDRKNAILLAATSSYAIEAKMNNDTIVNEILKFKREMNIDDENKLVILRALSFSNATVAKDLLATRPSLFNRDAASALTMIHSLREKRIRNEDVIEVITYSHDPEMAKHIIDFFKTFPNMREKAMEQAPTGYIKYNASGMEDAVKAYYEKPAEIEVFVRHLLERQASIPYVNLRDFMNDPTLPLCIEIYKVLKDKDPETALRIGRSLSAQGMTTIPDIATLNAKIQEWSELQASVNHVKILDGRNVVVLNNGERWNENGDGYKKGDLRFNGEERRKSFVKSVGPDGTIAFFAPPSEKPKVEELQNVKNKTLEKIATTPPPMTFFFNGHGAPNGLYMNNGQVVGDKPVGSDIDLISDKELAGAISKRKEKFSRDALSQDIYIYSSCMSHNFIRNVYAEIKSLGGVAPISIGESEYGQYGYSVQQKFDMMYQLGVRGTTIEHLRKNEGKYLSSNFTIYVPNKEGIPQQISKTDKKSGSV